LIFNELGAQVLEELKAGNPLFGKDSVLSPLLENIIKAWRSRSLEPVYAIVWLDAIHYKVMDERGACKINCVTHYFPPESPSLWEWSALVEAEVSAPTSVKLPYFISPIEVN